MGVVVNPQIVILYDANGVALAVQDGVAIPASTPAILLAGSDGTNARYMRTATDGTVRTDPTGTTTQPISAASLPLPTGAAQEHATAGSPSSTRLSDGTTFYDAAKTGQLPSALTGSGNLKAAIVEAIAAGSNLIGRVQLRNPGDTANMGDATTPVRVDPTGTTTQPVSGTVTANQGTPNTAANRWPVQHTDGTNFLPTMDVAARAGFFKQTDGTNVAPTGDVAARKVFVQPTDGTNTAGYDAQNHAFVAGKSAVGVAPTANPVAVSGVDDGGLKRAWLTWTDGSARLVPNSHRSVIHSNATITASGSTVLSGLGMSEWYLVVNIKNAPTGTTPTITFKIETVDPVDQTTVIDATTTVTGVAHTGISTEALQLADNITDTVKISWTVTGTTPSFTGVNVSWVGHVAGNAIEGQAEDGQPLDEGPVPVAGVDATNNVRTLKVAADGSLIVAATGTDKSNGSRAGYVVLGGGTSGSFNAVRATAYNEQTTNGQRSLSSASVLDTSAGTGARSVEITYYDQTGAGPFTETVILNGLTAVNTVSTTICFIESMVVKTAGALGSNQGIITLWTGTGGLGTIIGTIGLGTFVTLVGDNRTLWAHHYVATGKTCRISTFVVGASAATNFLFRSKNPTSSTSPEVMIDSGVVSTTAEFRRDSSTPPPIVGPARVTLYAIPSTNNVTINGTFDFYE